MTGELELFANVMKPIVIAYCIYTSFKKLKGSVQCYPQFLAVHDS